MEGVHDEDAAQQWQLDLDTSLVLSDVHMGCGVRSRTAVVQTATLAFSWSCAEVNCQRERAKVLVRPATRRHIPEHGAATATERTSDRCSEKHVSTRDVHGEPFNMHFSDNDTGCDADGDLVLPRRPRAAPNPTLTLAISHRMATPLRDVGLQVSLAVALIASPSCQLSAFGHALHRTGQHAHAVDETSLQPPYEAAGRVTQVWRGSLLLAEYVLSRAAEFAGVTACELGAGTGVAGIALACAGARRVFVTDVGESVLGKCQVQTSVRSGLSQSARCRPKWCKG